MAGYDEVVLGSAVYAGRWLEPATELAHRIPAELPGRPVWLFTSGPVGQPRGWLTKKMTVDPVDLPAIHTATGAPEHRMFAAGSTVTSSEGYYGSSSSFSEVSKATFGTGPRSTTGPPPWSNSCRNGTQRVSLESTSLGIDQWVKGPRTRRQRGKRIRAGPILAGGDERIWTTTA